MDLTTKQSSTKKICDKKSLITDIIYSLAIAYFLTSILFFIHHDLTQNLYTLGEIPPIELLILIPLFILFFYLSFFILKELLSLNLNNILSSVWLLFLLIFAFYSPVKSLVIGAILLSIPAIYSSLAIIFDPKKSYKTNSKINLYLIITAINSLMFIALLVIYFIKSKTNNFVAPEINLSEISNEIIYNEILQSRWRTALLIFAIALFIYLVSIILNNYFSLTKKKVLIFIGYSIVATIFVLQIVSLSMMMIYRIKVFAVPTFDFGIFSQMFFNMSSFNGMVTTLERSQVLSHNHVHFSPIFYLMLPFFMIFPKLETLQILQILIVASGIIPLYLITKELKTKNFIQILVLIMYIASPALITSNFWDLHENCFLAPLLLFVIYFLIKRNTLPIILSATLTLLIKEDAGIYLVFIGIFWFFTTIFSEEKNKKKDLIHSLGLVFISLLYFTVIITYLEKFGDGAMFFRFDSINAYPNLGLYGIVLGALQNPYFFLATFFSPTKINTMLILIASVGFLPLFMKNKAAYLLAIPTLVINYLSTYPYQHEFGFQYFYGSATLLIFMVLLAEKDHRNSNTFMEKYKNISIVTIFALLGVIVAVVHSTNFIGERLINNMYLYSKDSEKYREMRHTLEAIPNDKRVVATAYLTSYLSNRFYLYDYFYYDISDSKEPIDYIIVDLRISDEKLNEIIEKSKNAGFTESNLSTEYILIFEPRE